MKGTARVVVTGSGSHVTCMAEFIDRLKHQITEVIIEPLLEEFDRLSDALMDLTDFVEEVLTEDDVVFGETATLDRVPLLTWIQPVSVHARDPPWIACTGHAKNRYK